MTDLALPALVRQKIDSKTLDEQDLGRLGNRLLRVEDTAGQPAFLKIGTGMAAKDLLDEASRLQWIGDRLSVPRVHAVEAVDDTAFLLISALPGSPAHEVLEGLSPERVVHHMADALRDVHALPTADCPFSATLDDELEESERRIEAGLIDLEGFRESTGGAPREVLEDLQERRDIIQDLVFTHGDYCLPNLMLLGDAVSGILDWGIAGVADRHRDFFSMELTVRRNSGEEWIESFYARYGIDEVDRERIEYYRLLDQFFSHYIEP